MPDMIPFPVILKLTRPKDPRRFIGQREAMRRLLARLAKGKRRPLTPPAARG